MLLAVFPSTEHSMTIYSFTSIMSTGYSYLKSSTLSNEVIFYCLCMHVCYTTEGNRTSLTIFILDSLINSNLEVQ